MELNRLKAQLEAVLFAAGEPLPVSRLAELFEVDEQTLSDAVSALEEDYSADGRGIQLLRLEDSIQLGTKDSFADMIRAALEIRKNTPLSQAAMEVLSIIAYNQPVTKSFIEQVRGVESGQIVNNLAEKGLVEEAGRLSVPGRPISYRTTLHFLRCFGLESLEDLPELPDPSGQISFDEYERTEDLSGEQDDQTKDG